MKAIVLTSPCEATDMTLTEIPVPEVRPGWVLIKVKAFGINHSEVLLRQFEVARPYINKPIVPGIECVGKVVDPSDSGLKKGQRVMALMGGMGRSYNGSYAEYALLPSKNVFPIESNLNWNELAAIPETFYTAYGSLLEKYPAGATKVLELIGASTLRESLRLTAFHGIVCHTGLLGGVFGIKDFDPIKEIPSGIYLTGFYSNYPSKTEIDDMMALIERNEIHPIIANQFPFSQISDAHLLAEQRGQIGKIVVTV